MKNKLRKQFLLQRNNLSDRNIKNEIIKNKVLNSEVYQKCKIIFTYVNIGSEVDTIEIIKHSLLNNKVVATPKIIENKMIFVKIDSLNDLKLGKFNILESISNNEIKSNEYTMLLIPALVFDKNNYRLGYGGGYYDRYLCNIKCLKKVGLAYDFQIIESVPKNDFDIPVDFVITN